MKLWQYLPVLGLWLGFSVAQAQEEGAAPQPETTQQEESAPEGAQPADAETGNPEGGEPAREALTPEALFENVVERAQTMAGEAYQAPQTPLPESLAGMDFSEYRDIRFRPEDALWRDERLFEVHFFHPGFLYVDPVDIHVLSDGQVEELTFDSSMFNYEGNTGPLREQVDAIDPERMGFAGFRLHYPLNTPNHKDEFVVFLGASYFRMVGRDQKYGISARGLAVNTATQGGEEFPAFRAFWLVEPEPDASRITVFALLDSPSLTGAYRFDIEAASRAIIDVDSRLFARDDVGKLGVAPLTSMFLHGENSNHHFDDFRPEAHDSDGLLMHTSGGQWIWRPLSNPRALNVTQLRDNVPRGFGLMQRDRDFENYLDTALDYQDRPGLWVDPWEGAWGEGGVELVEIPTDAEVNDNIVAYWVPDAEFRAGDERRYRYRLSTYGESTPQQQLGRVIRTRSGWGAMPGQSNPPPRSLRRFVVDFRGGEELASLSAAQPVDARLSVSRGQTSDLQVMQLPDGRTWRAMFKLSPEDGAPADMQLQLMLRGRPLTETWSYIWNPDVLR